MVIHNFFQLMSTTTNFTIGNYQKNTFYEYYHLYKQKFEQIILRNLTLCFVINSKYMVVEMILEY